MTLFDGKQLKEKLASRLRASLDSLDFDKSLFSTVKGSNKQMDDVYHEEREVSYVCECRIGNLETHLERFLKESEL